METTRSVGDGIPTRERGNESSTCSYPQVFSLIDIAAKLVLEWVAWSTYPFIFLFCRRSSTNLFSCNLTPLCAELDQLPPAAWAGRSGIKGHGRGHRAGPTSAVAASVSPPGRAERGGCEGSFGQSVIRREFLVGRQAAMTSDAQTRPMNQCQFVPNFRARDLWPESPRTKPFHTRQQRLFTGYVRFCWRTVAGACYCRVVPRGLS